MKKQKEEENVSFSYGASPAFAYWGDEMRVFDKTIITPKTRRPAWPAAFQSQKGHANRTL
jgi:hypothetical protein